MPNLQQIERLKVLQKRRKEEIVFLQVCEKFITADQQILAEDATHKISKQFRVWAERFCCVSK